MTQEMIIIPNKVYDVREASQLLGSTPLTVTEYCRDGKIKAVKMGEWKILGQSLIDFLQLKSSDPYPSLSSTKEDVDKVKS